MTGVVQFEKWFLRAFQHFLFNACFRLAKLTEYYQDEWCPGNDSPLNSTLNYLLPSQKNIPMPTLFAGSESNRKPPKSSITQLVFYNMASLLASVAAGYDVRMSNVSPVHPKLQPATNGSEQHNETDNFVERTNRLHADYGTPHRTFPHNTYHGPTKHVR